MSIRQNSAAEQAEALGMSLFVDLLQAIRAHFSNGAYQWMEINGTKEARLHSRYMTDNGPVVITRAVTLTTTYAPETGIDGRPVVDAPVDQSYVTR